MSKTLAVLALTLPAANAASHSAYTWTKGTKICAGIKIPCTDKATCSATAVGPCPDGAKAPTAFLESKFEGMAFVNSKEYLDPATGAAKAADSKTYNIIEATGPGFRDYKGSIEADGGKFGFTMVGNVFGDTTKTGGYAGLVSYLNTGTTTLETNSAEVFGAATGDVQTDRSGGSDWSDSDKGAPHGPYKVCITEIGADKTCGAKRSFKPDEYKFSIYGSVSGPEYDATVVAGKNGFPAGMDKLGIRMQLKATGFEVKDLKVNGKSWDKSMVNDDVKSMFIMHDSGGLNLEFPKKYNTGSSKGAEVGKALTNTGTHDMAIRISTVDAATQTISIDYLFDTSKLTSGTWFIYDPDVTEVAKGSADPNAAAVNAPSSSDDGAANTYTIAAATFSAVAAVVGLLM
jgi:hypothetical protein